MILSLSTNAVLINFLLSLVLPAVVAFVTARVATSTLKSIILLALSAISGVLTQVLSQGGDFHWKAALLSFAQVFIASVATHFGFLKPTGVTGSQGAIQMRVPQGLGYRTGGPQPLSPGHGQ